MLDFNPRPAIADRINALVDAALDRRAGGDAAPDYLGASRLGHACERALQFEFAAAPKDEGPDFGGQTAAHLRDRPPARGSRDPLAARRRARSLHPKATGRMAASSASPSRAVASGAMSTGSSLPPRRRLACAFPRSGNARP